jgi:dTDP-4-dehydrorhamnose reductase
MKVVLFGSSGQLGHWLGKTKPSEIELSTPSKTDVDFCDCNSICDYILDNKPDWIINAAAYTNVDKAEEDLIASSVINGDAPASAAWGAQLTESKLLHISSDYIFDGSKGKPYKIKDTPNPINHYGYTKLRGEEAIVDILPENMYCILRTSGVYSHRRSNFFLSIFEKLVAGESFMVVADQITRFTSARALAEICWRVVLNDIYGTHHYAETPEMSRYEFASVIREKIIEKQFMQDVAKIIPVKSSKVITKAKRPLYSVLNNTLSRSDFGLESDVWERNLLHTFYKSAFLGISDELFPF